jgi:hypothetical protein
MAVVLLGEVGFRLAFFISVLAVDDLEKAKAVNGDVTRGVRMKRRLPHQHQNPILALYVSRKPGAELCCQAQRAIASSSINVVLNRAAHRKDDSNQSSGSNRICGLTLPVKVRALCWAALPQTPGASLG